jgi:hypothetical protein
LVSVIDDSGQEHIFRRIRVDLNKKTRNAKNFLDDQDRYKENIS